MNLPDRLRRSATIALIVSPTGLLLIAVIRLLIVSNYNAVTASTIVSSGGYVDTLLGTVIPLIPIFLPYIGLALMFFRRVIPGVLALAASLLISPASMPRAAAISLAREDCRAVVNWSDANGFIFVLLGLLLIGLLMGTIVLGFTTFIRTVGTIASLALLPFVVQLYPLPHHNSYYANQLRQPWLPAETITLASHQEVIGYTLSSDSDWLVFLRNYDRHVVYYRQSEVADRHVCQIGNAAALRPLVTLAPASARTPRCGLPGSSYPVPQSPAVVCPPALRPSPSPIGVRPLKCGAGQP
jgi:hypothetical protein